MNLEYHTVKSISYDMCNINPWAFDIWPEIGATRVEITLYGFHYIIVYILYVYKLTDKLLLPTRSQMNNQECCVDYYKDPRTKACLRKFHFKKMNGTFAEWLNCARDSHTHEIRQ